MTTENYDPTNLNIDQHRALIRGLQLVRQNLVAVMYQDASQLFEDRIRKYAEQTITPEPTMAERLKMKEDRLKTIMNKIARERKEVDLAQVAQAAIYQPELAPSQRAETIDRFFVGVESYGTLREVMGEYYHLPETKNKTKVKTLETEWDQVINKIVIGYSQWVEAEAINFAGVDRHNRDYLGELTRSGMKEIRESLKLFDVYRGTVLTSLAKPRLNNVFRTARAEYRGLIHLPARDKLFSNRVKAYHDLRKELGRDPENGEIATKLKMTLSEYETYKNLERTTSLDAPLTVGAEEIRGNFIPDDDHPDPATAFNLESGNARLKQMIGQLPEIEGKILRMRYLEDCTQKETGIALGLSHTTVAKYEKRGMDQLRTALLQQGISNRKQFYDPLSQRLTQSF